MAVKKTRKASKKTTIRKPPKKNTSAKKVATRKTVSRAGATRALRADAGGLVLSVLAETFGDLKITAATKLSALGFTKPGLAALAARIKARGIHVDTAAIQNCTTVGDVIKVVANA